MNPQPRSCFVLNIVPTLPKARVPCWIIERRDTAGRWHATARKALFYTYGRPRIPLRHQGLPDDAAAGTRQAHACFTGELWGYAGGLDVLSWQDAHPCDVADFAMSIIAVLGEGSADAVLAALEYSTSDGVRHADDTGNESAHARAARLRATATLADWRSDPAAWRLILHHDP